jgi:BASS family bile acid:Na+ symporter
LSGCTQLSDIRRIAVRGSLENDVNDLLLNTTRFAILVFLLTSMVEMGLSLTFGEVLASLKNLRLIALSLLANFVLVPMLAFAIIKGLGLDQPFAIGLLLLALAPGAPFIPKVVQLARGNLAFAVGLMVLLMIGTVFDLPMILPRIISGVTVHAWEIEKSLLLLMLLPLFVGFIVHRQFSTLPGWARPALRLVSNVSSLVVLLLILALNYRSVLSVFGTGAIFAGVLFVVLSALMGYVLGGSDRATRHSLGLATGLRNVAVALLVGAQNFKDPKVNVMVIVTALVGLVILLPVAAALGRHTPRQLNKAASAAAKLG